jgi:hypothetical protein
MSLKITWVYTYAILDLKSLRFPTQNPNVLGTGSW